ncbi:MAG: universal stress protein [Phaeodactylibacter sp.]|nr:universal stress protein [Phaeodactylibacter sp.]MCB9272799.1 universal stress protein [Lewinellaceae bacterium]
MKKILVAIDFSPASGNAYEYALWLSIETGASLNVLYVNTATEAEETVSEKQRQAMVRRENEAYRERLRRFTMNYPHYGPHETLTKALPEAYLVANGGISSAIAATARDIGAGLLVVGGHANHQLRDYLFGSVTTHLIGKIPCPALLVPEEVNYKRPKTIALAVEGGLKEAGTPPSLKNLARELGAKIEAFNVDMLPEGGGHPGGTLQQSGGVGGTTTVHNESVRSGIQYYLAQNPADWLALYLPRRTFPERLLHGRLARHLVWNSSLPLLLVPEREDAEAQ